MPETKNEVAFLDRQQPTFTVEEAQQIASHYFGLQGEFKSLLSERDQNFRITTATGERFVLKISNAYEDMSIVDMQCQVLAWLEAQDPTLPVSRMVRTKSGTLTDVHVAEDGTRHMVRVVHYLEGELLGDVPNTKAVRHNLGGLIARLDIALNSFFHPSARQNHPWDITRCVGLRPQTKYIQDEMIRGYVVQIFDQMEQDVLPRLKRLRHQVIHQDAHTRNVLVSPQQAEEITGLIDFGDMIYAPLICEVAVAASSCASDSDAPDPVEVMCDIAAGYDHVLPLQGEEVDLLYDLVLARHAITITVLDMRKALFPDDTPHIEGVDVYRQRLDGNLKLFFDLGRARVCDAVRSACRFPPYFPAEDSEEDVLLGRRQQVLGEYAPYFYKKPLHLERAKGVWLYGADGKRYLDCYNNIPVVGHCHPHVIKGVVRQMEALNTHTRYQYRVILAYAEGLRSSLPAHLSACLFVNSGSEANDVAFQMAQFVTGKRGAVVMEDAYHGITESVTALSPSRPGVILQAHVAGLVTPDSYAGIYRDNIPDCAEQYAKDTDRAITDLREKGFGVAALMVDTALASSGIPDPPKGYFAGIERRVRKAGGLIICDEVQAGFGRMGVMWGHLLRGMKADIVTMGKPVGNGFPLGVVVTTPDILNAFMAETKLFSTFGGNPVACAAGRAVLDVLESENLVANAKATGIYFREQLRQLMVTQPLIGDVRGEGLLVAVALVTDRAERTPASAETKHLLEILRQNGVITGKAGRHGNILKVRPPIVFQPEHVDFFVERLDKSLSLLSQT